MIRFAEVVKTKRSLLKEDQTTFGKRFGVTATAISLWEQGKRDVPNRVLEEVLDIPEPKFVVCPNCQGAGLVVR